MRCCHRWNGPTSLAVPCSCSGGLRVVAEAVPVTSAAHRWSHRTAYATGSLCCLRVLTCNQWQKQQKKWSNEANRAVLRLFVTAGMRRRPSKLSFFGFFGTGKQATGKIAPWNYYEHKFTFLCLR